MEDNYMGNSELAIRFTENMYATKSEVSKELKMSLIDSIWSDILAYRANYYHYLTIKTIDRAMFTICLCPSISNNISSLSSKLVRINREYSRLGIDNGDLRHFETAVRIKTLKTLAASYNLDVTDNYLRGIVTGTVQETSDDHAILFRYNKALNYIKDSYSDPIDEEFLRGVYSQLTGYNSFSRFYRTSKDDNPLNKVIIDRVYTSAPVENIENMMGALFTFIEKSSLPGLVKALITYFYITYVRPVDTYSDEIAILMMKAVLAHTELYEFGVALPLESLFSEELKEVSRISIEVQKSRDITYFVNYALKFVDRKADEVGDIIINRQVNEIRNEFYQEEQAINVPEEVIEEPTPEIVEPAPTPKPVEKAEEPVKPVAVESKETNEEAQPSSVMPEIAIGYIPPALDEKQAARLEVHLLELDPSLKKNEAKFYARHCTMGKSYTIAQFKKSIGCVYETARTSMEHLVELGYYRRDTVNNKKFVYTPISRK